MSTIHNGIPLKKPSEPTNVQALRNDLRIPNECFVVLMVGRMIAAKGVATLLTAASSLVKTGPYVFLLAGDGPDLTQFKELAHSMAIAEHTRFLGFRQDIPALLQAADVFVLPSLSEGLPLSVLEAMAAARPVIATRVGGLPELVRNGVTGLLVSPGNAEELSVAIQTLAVDQFKRITMGKVGRQVVEEQFTEARMLDELNAVYVNVLGRTHMVTRP
jgi:glycosyltransferase involved in cell wall biosynthesis